MSNRWTVAVVLLLAGLPLLGQNPANQPYGNNPPGQVYGNSSGYAPNVVPDGTRLILRLDDTLDTTKLKVGKKFTAKLGEDLTTPAGTSIPAGHKIHGHVSEVDRGMHGRILLSFDEIETRHGWRPFAATVSDVPGEHGVKQGSEGEIEKKGANKRRVAEGAVAGAAVGAVTGAVVAGPHGAIVGAVAGGALGGGAGLLTDRDLKLNKGQQIEVRLDRPLQVP
ncbi:MAG: hypothetical protein ACR2IF_06990 [Terriglobales bacterium]